MTEAARSTALENSYSSITTVPDLIRTSVVRIPQVLEVFSVIGKRHGRHCIGLLSKPHWGKIWDEVITIASEEIGENFNELS